MSQTCLTPGCDGAIVPYVAGHKDHLNLAIHDVRLNQDSKTADVGFEVFSRECNHPDGKRVQHALLAVRVPFPKTTTYPYLDEIQKAAGAALLEELDRLRDQVGPVSSPARAS